MEEVGPSGLDHGIDALAASPDGRVYGHGEGGYYEMGKGGVMSLRTEALPLSGMYRIQFQLRSSKGKETRLRVWTGEDRFEVEIHHESWRWTEPMLVSLEEGVNSIHLANGGRRRLDIERVRIERDCPRPPKGWNRSLCPDRKTEH